MGQRDTLRLFGLGRVILSLLLLLVKSFLGEGLGLELPVEGLIRLLIDEVAESEGRRYWTIISCIIKSVGGLSSSFSPISRLERGLGILGSNLSKYYLHPRKF